MQMPPNPKQHLVGELLDGLKRDAGFTDIYLNGIERLGLTGPPDDGPAILIYDIETTPSLSWVWAGYKTNILAEQQRSYLLSFAYTWLGSDSVWFHGLNDNPDFQPNQPNDLWLAERLANLFDRADITVAHNGDRFDVKKTNTYLLYNQLPPPSPYQTIDTLSETKRQFAHIKNNLNYLTNTHGLGEKVNHVGIDLWFGCMAGNPEAWAKMEQYNVQDVMLLEDWYLTIRPWIGRPGKKAHPNLGHWVKGKRVCTNCGSEKVTPRGTHRTMVSEFQTYACLNCGAYSRARVRETQRGGNTVYTL